jgi:hypothetical protein
MPRADYGSSADAFFEQAAPELKPLADKVRSLILEAMPGVIEKIKWGTPVYTKPGNTDWTVAMRINKADVALQFTGASLHFDDPLGLLKGTGANMRHIRMKSLDDFRPDILREWLVHAYQAA